MSKIIAALAIAALLLTGTASTGLAGPATPVTTPPTTTAATEHVTTEPAVKMLTEDEAVEIALDHTGVTDPENLRVKSDREDGTQVWEIEFRSGDWEYDCTVHAQTGAVLEWDRDYEPLKTAVAATEPAVTEPPATVATEPAAKTLTKDEAVQIALAHAGLTADQVWELRAHLDDDDRTPEWEVEFRADRMEYEYSIHAESGKILEWEKELDD